MKATEVPVTKFLQKTQQFCIPIYQRTYSWTEKQCEQLWDDIVSAITKDVPSHFLGSIVYVEEGIYQVSDVQQLLVIDGQQRLTTLTLLFKALAKVVDEKKSNEITSKKIENYFLFNSEETGEKRYKLILTQSDRDTLRAIVENRPIPEKHSKKLVNNFEYLQNKITKSEIDLNTIYQGILKLIVVDIALDRDKDKPQLIFESLNSTGLALSQTDLIRNYIFMGLEQEVQNRIYSDFWHPMEESFGDSDMFDDFIRDYLTIKTGQISIIRDVYSSFKEYATMNHAHILETESIGNNLYNFSLKIEKLVSDIHYSAGFYTRLIFENEKDTELNQIIKNINTLNTNVAYPFLLEVYIDFDKNKITRNEILEIFRMVENYVFRRAICDIPTNSLNKTFAGLADSIDKSQYVESLKARFCLLDNYRRFPTDNEFVNSFISKDVYNTRIKKHLFDRLENYNRKEKVRISVDDYTIEHIMPQSKNLTPEWKNDLGPDWKEIHEKYLHVAGNLTLTGYNSELSNRPFLEKRDMEGGFKDSPIRLNGDLTKLDKWGKSEIMARSETLARRSIKIWQYPNPSKMIVEKYSNIDDDDPEDDGPSPQWDYRIKRTSEQIRNDLNILIKEINEKFDCVEEPYLDWLIFYVKKPTENKNTFAVLECSKSTANVAFRINPETFQSEHDVRKVAGFFFPRGTERKMYVTTENLPKIMSMLEHSYNTTIQLLRTKYNL